MPRKERAAAKTRGEQLPTLHDFFSAFPRTIFNCSGTWQVDEITERLVAKDRLAPNVIGHEAGALVAVRAITAQAGLNAYTFAYAVYSDREARSERADDVATIASLQKQASYFIDKYKPLRESIAAPSPEWPLPVREMFSDAEKSINFDAIDDAERLIVSLEMLKSDICALDDEPIVGGTADMLAKAFVDKMRSAWVTLVGPEQKHGDLKDLIDLAVSAWIDTKLPDHGIDRGSLHARIAKRFAQKGKVAPSE
tara:strand:- start:14233 stop:14991 length:759 start_codon:yes stop_codon:yes gene_type:complete